jgi:hypothetical protein
MADSMLDGELDGGPGLESPRREGSRLNINGRFESGFGSGFAMQARARAGGRARATQGRGSPSVTSLSVVRRSVDRVRRPEREARSGIRVCGAAWHDAWVQRGRAFNQARARGSPAAEPSDFVLAQLSVVRRSVDRVRRHLKGAREHVCHSHLWCDVARTCVGTEMPRVHPGTGALLTRGEAVRLCACAESQRMLRLGARSL